MNRTIKLCLCLLMLTAGLTLTCALADTLALPDSATRIEEEAFYGDTSLDEVLLPEGTTYIGPRAFGDTSLARIYLPDSLTDIADDAFDPGMTLIVPAGSQWVQWAEDNGYVAVEE